MSVSNKLKALLKMFGKNHADSAEELEINRQSFTNKLNRNGFKAHDLIKLAHLTGTKLAFIDENDKPVITFDMDDIKEDD